MDRVKDLVKGQEKEMVKDLVGQKDHQDKVQEDLEDLLAKDLEDQKGHLDKVQVDLEDRLVKDLGKDLEKDLEKDLVKDLVKDQDRHQKEDRWVQAKDLLQKVVLVLK